MIFSIAKIIHLGILRIIIIFFILLNVFIRNERILQKKRKVDTWCITVF